VDGEAAPDQAAHLVALAQPLEGEGEDGLDLGRVRRQGQFPRVGDVADEGVDDVVGDEGASRRQGLADLDLSRAQADLLLGLAQRRGLQAGVAVVAAAAREGDLAGVAAQVGAALGEDQARILGPAVERQQDGRLDGGADQMITWTVPPSTDQAAPAT
jgi:hypothetical protein